MRSHKQLCSVFRGAPMTDGAIKGEDSVTMAINKKRGAPLGGLFLD